MSDLRAVLAGKGTVATQNNIRAVIKSAGYRWKQARVTLTSVDPNYREKLAAIRATLSNLADDEAFFSIDEFGPFAVKTRAGRSLQAPKSGSDGSSVAEVTRQYYFKRCSRAVQKSNHLRFLGKKEHRRNHSPY
jgi:hypothetical protein